MFKRSSRSTGPDSSDRKPRQPRLQPSPAVGEQKVFKDVLWELQTLRKTADALRLIMSRSLMDEVQAFVDQTQLGFLETVNALGERGLSFARFGDGEIRTMLRPEYNLAFQRNSPALAADLRRILSPGVDSEELLVGFPHVYRDVHWSGVWADTWNQAGPLFRSLPLVGNSHVSRPLYFEYTGVAGVEAWRRVWDRRPVAIVTGAGSRFELLPELFDNVSDAAWLSSQPRQAYEDLERIHAQALALPKGVVFLVALGPAGTVLSARLAAEGRRALDIGHISDSYQVAFKEGAWPESKPPERTTPIGEMSVT